MHAFLVYSICKNKTVYISDVLTLAGCYLTERRTAEQQNIHQLLTLRPHEQIRFSPPFRKVVQNNVLTYNVNVLQTQHIE